MLFTKRRQWALAAGIAGAAAAQLTDHLMTSSWRLAARKDPPDDPAYADVDWKTAIAWTVAAGAAGALTQMLARHGAGLAWKQLTGERPPRRRKRARVRSKWQALA